MASITPALTAATSGFVPPGSFYSGPVSAASDTLTDGSVKVLAGFKLRVYYFSSVGDGDLWDSDSTTPPPPGTVRAFWSGDAHAADPANFVVLSST